MAGNFPNLEKEMEMQIQETPKKTEQGKIKETYTETHYNQIVKS